LEYNFGIIPFLFEYKPHFNNRGTYLLNLLNINMSIGINIAYYTFFQCLMIFFYISLRKAKNSTKLFDFAFIFYQAGFMCFILGYILWNKGCLDYIYLRPLFVFDLKDIYLSCFVCLFFIFLYKKRVRTLKEFLELLKQKDNLL
jgi:hypothetical protein